ncbi:ABC transporter family substrate-binding protein [Rhodococcus rhodnii]|nr:ABC transporter family substrate-binding protein [Rhodococcus rhodnii]TXG92859.1 ABC transporter family substrate-binding protein [Rhodococcus rhodnii]
MRRRVGVAATAVLALGVAACTAAPPPPVESTETETTTAPATPADSRPFVVGIDDVGNGFNPHLLADQSPANAAVASLVLPSPFRAASNGDRPELVDWLPDPALLVSAQVTSTDPFTITYVLRGDAQWSDGAPVAAEDFRYLWQQMISRPGVVDPAGYRLIEDVRSSGGGKTVTVELRDPYPAWQQLFTDLLPSHLLKDSPGGFESGLADGIPVSASYFGIESFDRGRDEIVLERNDRYWGTPAAADSVVMRRAGTSAQLADSMRTNDTQLALVRGDEVTAQQLRVIPNVRTAGVAQPRMLEVMLNGRVPELVDVRVRRALLGLLDVDLLARVADRSDPAVVRSLVYAPSDPEYAPTAPPPLGRDAALATLAEAGWTRTPTEPEPVPETTTTSTPAATPSPLPVDDPLQRTGDSLALTIGVPEGDDVARAVAATASDQLRGAGVEASVVELEAEELYGEALTSGEIGAVIGWNRAGVDPATAVASRFSCLPDPAEAPTPPTPPAGDADTDENDPMRSALEAPSNLTGLCDPTVAPAIDAALRGEGDVTATLRDVDTRLWGLATVLPVVQDGALTAAGPSAGDVALTGPLPSTLFADAHVWNRAD